MNVVERLVGRLSPGGSAYIVRDPPADEPVSVQIMPCHQQLSLKCDSPCMPASGPAAPSLALVGGI